MGSSCEKRRALDLFGGHEGWDASKWTASDDRVRGGKSQSYLDIPKSGTSATFYGTLDIKTLGGAGFASQKVTDNWDLSDYAAVTLNVAKGDKKRYTVIFKDKLLPSNQENGREQATISYEADFTLPPETIPGDSKDHSVTIPFASLNATYRGKLQKDAPAINKKSVKQISLMMRSFFGTQEGDFSLTLDSISAIPKIPKHGSDDPSGGDAEESKNRAVSSKQGANVDCEAGQGARKAVNKPSFGRLVMAVAGVAGLGLVIHRLVRWVAT